MKFSNILMAFAILGVAANADPKKTARLKTSDRESTGAIRKYKKAAIFTTAMKRKVLLPAEEKQRRNELIGKCNLKRDYKKDIRPMTLQVQISKILDVVQCYFPESPFVARKPNLTLKKQATKTKTKTKKTQRKEAWDCGRY